MSAAVQNGASIAPADTVTVIVNDEPRTVPVSASLASLIAELGLVGRKGVAIAINGEVVPRVEWPTRAVRDGDRVLVIRATQGG